MKQTVTFSDFVDAFRDCGRKDQFSYDALRVLFDSLDRLDEDCGTETELDVIAICCEFSEDDWQDIADYYSIDLSDCGYDNEKQCAVVDYLQENTFVCGVIDGRIVYQSF